jgi:hypothetical protein
MGIALRHIDDKMEQQGKEPWEDRAKKSLTLGGRIDSFGKFWPWVLKKGDK